MAKTYRTANGGKVDLGALILSNENTRSAGNMGVNARGDKLNSHNQVIETRNEQIQRAYDMTVRNQPVDELPPTSIKHAKKFLAFINFVGIRLVCPLSHLNQL